LTGSGKGYKGRNTMWIARDKSGGLFLYDNKPRKNKDEYAVRHGWGGIGYNAFLSICIQKSSLKLALSRLRGLF
jgi:hypothetical protein